MAYKRTTILYSLVQSGTGDWVLGTGYWVLEADSRAHFDEPVRPYSPRGKPHSCLVVLRFFWLPSRYTARQKIASICMRTFVYWSFAHAYGCTDHFQHDLC